MGGFGQVTEVAGEDTSARIILALDTFREKTHDGQLGCPAVYGRVGLVNQVPVDPIQIERG